MEKFIYLFRDNVSTPNLSPDAMQAHMQKWYEWMQQLLQNGTMLAGEPLETVGKQVNGTKKTVTDGPFIEAKEMVGGYMIVDAKDMNEAVEISKGCPIFDTDGKVEIRPIRKMDM